LRAPQAAQLQLPHTLVCRLIPGYQYLLYKREQRQKFFSSEYLVSPRTDRMGYQLEGASILSPGQSLLSEGICYGAVQLPADGQPFVLLNDCQTIGGYPKLGAILSLDLWKLAQLGPGSRLRFRPISAVRARRLLFKYKRAFESTAPELLDESSL
jgi:allophanate hydrolase subunit 2